MPDSGEAEGLEGHLTRCRAVLPRLAEWRAAVQVWERTRCRRPLCEVWPVPACHAAAHQAGGMGLLGRGTVKTVILEWMQSV